MPGPPILEREALVLEQRARVRDVRNEYAVLDQGGERLGTVTESRQAALASLMRLSRADLVLLPVTLELRDAEGTLVLRMSKPWGRVVSHVERGDGTSLGSMRRRWRLGKVRFELVAENERVAMVHAKNWRASDFTIVDVTGRELARAERQRGGVAVGSPTDADYYLIRIHHERDEPLRSLAVGAALALEAVVPHGD